MAKKPTNKGPAKRNASKTAAVVAKFVSEIKSTGANSWYAVLLIDRGLNVNTVNMIEQAAGGDKTRPTPYQVAAYPARPAADHLEHTLDLAGANARVQQV